MSYWNDQPMNIAREEEIVKPIISDPSKKKNYVLPSGFEFKTLNLNYLNEIHSLLSNHYVEDTNHIVRLVYPKDFLYWYLKYIPDGFIVGLIYKNKLVGLITAIFLDMIIYGNELKVPYVNLLCIQKKIRDLGFAPMLIDEIKLRICDLGINYALFTGMNTPTKSFCTLTNFAIPINYPKLKEINFLTENISPLLKLESNPLHLMVASDIESIIPKLNKFMEKFLIRPYFTEDSAHHFLLPKKNIIYSFVKRNEKGDVTDFISTYKNYYFCIQKQKMISVCLIAFYYYETLTLTELVTFLIDKLPSYKIDQLSFHNMADNQNINIMRFLTDAKLNYFFYNVNIKETPNNKLCFYPI